MPGKGYRYQNSRVKIYQHHTGDIEVLHGEEVLKVVALDKTTKGPILADRKDIDRVFDQEILPKINSTLSLPTGSTAPEFPCT